MINDKEVLVQKRNEHKRGHLGRRSQLSFPSTVTSGLWSDAES